MKTKTARPRRTPQRTCVSCGTTTAKRELVRIVRTPEGEITPDASGKKSGRGAYLCSMPGCWERGVRKGRLEKSLKTKLSEQDRERLSSFAEEFVSGSPA